VSDAVDMAITEDGAQTMVQLYAAKIRYLRSKIIAATLDETDKQNLLNRLTNFEMSIGPKGQNPNPELAARTFNAIDADLTTAIALNQTKGTLAQNFISKVDAVTKKITNSKLNQQLNADFARQ